MATPEGRRARRRADGASEGAEPLAVLTRAWRSAVSGPRTRAIVAAGVLVLVAALLVARAGTLAARVVAVLVLLVSIVALVVARVLDDRVFRDPARTIRRVASRIAPEESARAIRALSLLRPETTLGTSTELATLHVQRSIAALPVDDVRRGASRVGFVFALAAFVFAALDVAACASNPWGTVEGADILVAHGGVAPVGMAWLSEPQLRARPPDYLHQEERRLAPFEEAPVPRGTLLTMRGAPVHAGRRLLLTDGSAEVPFVDDGSGHVVARWPVAESVKLHVVARFGDVVIPEGRETPIESIPDLPPLVSLEGAPRQIRLGSGEENTSEIPIHYEATDDHGLREVHLVLRAGSREERRVLARLDGETKSDRGGHNLRTADPFIKKSHAPIEIRVEAKDNDPITGPKWGASPAITVVPPDVGEPESRRLAALLDVRAAVVDALAWRISNALPSEPKDRREFLERDTKLSEELGEKLEGALLTSYAGVRVQARLGAMLRGRMRKVKEATDNQTRSPSSNAHANVVKATERMALVIDGAIQGLGLRDTHDVARELAEVADELGVAAQTAQKAAEKARAEQRMDAAVLVLGGGGAAMRKLGALGRDIGEIVAMDLARVARARTGGDLPHTVLAAQDLAARLRQPDPSFGARGGRPGHAGGESGGGRGASGGEDGEPNDVEQAFNEAARDLERLTAEHAGQLGKTEQAIANGSTKEDIDALAEDAKKHADKVRDAVKPLPSVGGGSDSWTSKGAAAREHAEQMAKALESGNAADAVQSGQSAAAALDEAKRAAQRERWGRSDPQAERTIDEARRALDGELKWAQEKLDELRKRAASRAGQELREQGDAEGKLGDRAREIAKKGGAEGDIPESAADALEDAERAAKEAAKALKDGDAERGLKKQREAQQKLETALEALGEREPRDGKDGESNDPRDHADIPKADAHKGPEEFRKRVIKGLGQPSNGRFKDAVKRYAEGLLR